MSYELKRQDIFDFAGANGFETKEKGDELLFKYCPYCNGGANRDQWSFSINTENGAYNCFRASCAQKGHFVELCRDFGYNLPGVVAAEYRRLPQPKSPIIPKPQAIKYLQSRGISEAIVRKYEITVRKDNPSILCFQFFDDTGYLSAIKYRNTKYRKGTDKNKEWFENKTEPILYGMKQCEDFSRLVITEGQIDSLSLAEAGIKNAVSVPNGANGMRWVNRCKEWMLKFEEIVVFGDYEKGHITLIDPLRSALPNKSIKCVRPIDYLGEKDANDILMKYGTRALVKAVEKAEAKYIGVVKDLSTVKAVNLSEIDKIKTGIVELDRTLEGGLMVGTLNVISGKRGEGKSTLASQIICSALEQGESVFAYSGELPNYFFKNWLDMQLCGGDRIGCRKNEYGDNEYFVPDDVTEKINNWYRGRMYIYDNAYCQQDEDGELDSIPSVIEDVVLQYGVRLILVDNLMSAMEDSAEADNLNFKQSKFVGDLKKICLKYDVVIILIAHPRKSKEQFSNDDISGSGDITNKADLVMNYCRFKPNEYDHGEGFNGITEESDYGRTVLSITKNRINGRLRDGDEGIRLLYSKKSRRVGEVSLPPVHYGWENDTSESTALPIETEYATEEELPF